MVKQKLSSN